MLKLSLLGAANISLEGQDVPLAGRPLALLAYLLLLRQPQLRTKLARLFHENSKNPQAQFRWTLNKLKQALGSKYLLTDRQTVSFDFEAPHQLDVDLLRDGEVDVYKGELLSGLHINEAVDFMNWLLFQREAFRQQCESLLTDQLERYLDSGSWEKVIVTAHRLLEMDNLREAWLTPLMQAYEQVGRDEQAIKLFEIYQRSLKKELELTPGTELQRYAVYLASKLAKKQSPPTSLHSRHLPAYLDQNTEAAASVPFVARQLQMHRLAELLKDAVSGKGQICFIKGGAGSGKSTLIRAFIQQATQAYPQLLIAYGRGTALNQVGIPYQPFIDILAMLLADVETAVKSQLLPIAQARRLWDAYPQTVEIVKTFGPDLLNSWLPHHEDIPKIEAPQSQAILFRQMDSILSRLATNYPLLLIIDDLHWADESSMSLLFHMGQRLDHQRIFLVGAYREDEIDTANTTHNQTIIEIRRRNGEKGLDLDAFGQEENGAFVNAFLDRELNQYSDQFRQAFLKQTNGHPLFSAELLEALKIDGLLFQDDDGNWQEKQGIAWQHLPTRVEAVIANRVNRLSEEIQQILAVAAVEGESFTIQAVAQVSGYPSRTLLKILEPASIQLPRLVHPTDEIQLNDKTLLRYRFSQILFQQYFYQRINPAETTLLHGEIAEVLENLYSVADKTNPSVLGYHYEKAGLTTQAVHYYQIAAETAVAQFANEDAVTYFSKALELLPQSEQVQRADFLLARERLHDLLGGRQQQAHDLHALQQMSQQLPETHLPTVYLLRQANFAFNHGDLKQSAQLATNAIKNSRATLEMQLMAHQLLGQIYLYQGKSVEAKDQFEQALNFAKELTSVRTEATIFRSFGLVSSFQGEFTMARSYLDKARSLHHQADSPLGEAKALQNLSNVEHRNSNYAVAFTHARQALAVFQKMGSRQGEAQMLQELGGLYLSLGNQRQAMLFQQQARQHFLSLGDLAGEAISLAYLGSAHNQQRGWQIAQNFAENAVTLMGKMNLRWHKCWGLTLLAKIFIGQEKRDEATQAIEEARTIWRSLDLASFHFVIQAVSADVALLNEDVETAVNLIQPILQRLDSRAPDGADDPFYIYAVCYRVLSAKNSDQAVPFLQKTHLKLQATANNVEGQSAQKDFLDNIISHQEIVTYYSHDMEVKA